MLVTVILGIVIGLIGFLFIKGVNVIPLTLMLLLIMGFAYMLKSKNALPNVSFGKKKVEIESITFEDIGGQEAAVRELKEALDFVNNMDAAKKYGIRPLKGILLFGPPGTGKTLLAKAAATYTDSVFIATSGSEFVEMYAGVGAQRVRSLFARAKADAKKNNKKGVIIFIDEIEVLGGKRGKVSNQTEYDQTINQLLVEMDGIGSNNDHHVLVMGATNRPDMLDSALLRPGRFDRQVEVDLPDKIGRLSILKLHTKSKPLCSDVNLEDLSKQTFGFSGAQLESLTNEAAIYGLRNTRDKLKHEDFVNAIEKVMVGEKTERQIALKEKQRIALHEAGHAYISEKLKPGSVANVTIIPRGKAMGFVREAPEEETYLQTSKDIRNKIATLVAGSTAEKLFLSCQSTGAKNDFEKAVQLAKNLIYAGLSKLGVVDEATIANTKVHDTVQEIIQEEQERVSHLLIEGKPTFEKITSALINEETISGENLRQLI